MNGRSEPDIRTGLPNGSESESNERTNERTDVEGQDARRSGSFAERAHEASGSTAITLERLLADAGVDQRSVDVEDARRISKLLERRYRSDEGMMIGQILNEWLDALAENYGKRWPVIRSGERDRIPNLIRLSVYARDDFQCQDRTVGVHLEDELELDHCIPWSAGGPDDTDNLRTLCSRCNTRRSNFIDAAHERRYRATTWWCLDCWSDESSRYHGHWKDGTHLETVPHIQVDSCGFVEQVYCAFCRRPSMSPLYFVGATGRRLIRQVWVPDAHPDRPVHRPSAAIA